MKRETRSQRLQPAGLTSKINSGEKTNEGSTGTDVVGRPTRAYHFIPSFLVINFLRATQLEETAGKSWLEAHNA
jgi:hypothetical protein